MPCLVRACRENLTVVFAARITGVALAYFILQGESRYIRVQLCSTRGGLPIDGFDGQIAAICRTRGAALATRNAKDFEETGIDVIDPWQQSQPADHTTPPTT